jgi:guanosine-3',5'-bis(diphosphate) 3'-pyrophosphohydrolase
VARVAVTPRAAVSAELGFVLSTGKPPRGIALILKAAEFAARKHRDQRRKDKPASPYINHPIALAEVLSRVGGITSSSVLAAALLHDTLEDTETTRSELKKAFGPGIAKIVEEVTDDKRLPKQRRKELQVEHAARISKSAKLIKLADKISNLSDIVTSPPAGWPLLRKREYFDWAKRVIDQVRGTNADLERRFDALYRKRP